MQEETKLLPCPFCEGEAKIVGSVQKYPECIKCYVSTMPSADIDECIYYWNTRSTDKTIEALREALENIRQYSENQINNQSSLENQIRFEKIINEARAALAAVKEGK